MGPEWTYKDFPFIGQTVKLKSIEADHNMRGYIIERGSPIDMLVATLVGVALSEGRRSMRNWHVKVRWENDTVTGHHLKELSVLDVPIKTMVNYGINRGRRIILPKGDTRAIDELVIAHKMKIENVEEHGEGEKNFIIKSVEDELANRKEEEQSE